MALGWGRPEAPTTLVDADVVAVLEDTLGRPGTPVIAEDTLEADDTADVAVAAALPTTPDDVATVWAPEESLSAAKPTAAGEY